MYTRNLNGTSHFNLFSKKNLLKKAALGLTCGALIINSKPEAVSAINRAPAIAVELQDYSNDYFYRYNSSDKKDAKLENALQKASSYLNVPFFGKDLISNKGKKEIQNAARGTENKINGYIDEPVIQGIALDCWLLCAINNLSYTPKGAQAIHEAISENENGDIEVYFKGPNLTYTVSLEELKQENEDYTLLSFGDDDMLAFEIAAKKYREDLANNKIEIDENLPEYLYKKAEENDFSPLNMGETRLGYWLLTGITDSEDVATTPQDIKALFEKFKQNPQESLLDVELEKEAIVNDINGNKVYLKGAHGYGVKNITDDVITLVPADVSVEEITLPIDTIDDLSILGVVYCKI